MAATLPGGCGGGADAQVVIELPGWFECVEEVARVVIEEG